MTWIRPATPGFAATLAATIFLAIVSISVPVLKSVYFLKASISTDSFQGDITFGTLGYCLDICNDNSTACSKPSLGYELGINDLVDHNLPIQIPQVVVKGVTHALVLHIVALVLSAVSAVFGLLAHVREMSMTCCSTFVSALAAGFAFVALVVDLILFFIARSRVSSFGGSVSAGKAIWLTLVACVLLILSGFVIPVGRFWVSRRHRGFMQIGRHDDREERLRLDVIRAKAGRKALQGDGLSAFYEDQPLTTRVDGESAYFEPYNDNHSATIPSVQSPHASYTPQGTQR